MVSMYFVLFIVCLSCHYYHLGLWWKSAKLIIPWCLSATCAWVCKEIRFFIIIIIIIIIIFNHLVRVRGTGWNGRKSKNKLQYPHCALCYLSLLNAPLDNVTRTFSINKKEVDHKKNKTTADRILLHVRCVQTLMTFAYKWFHFG